MPRKDPLSARESFTPPTFTFRENPTVVWQPPYRCATCDREYDSQERNFYKTHSELYAASNGYGVVCRSCLESYYKHAAEKLHGDEHGALLHIAQMMDWFVSDEIIDDVLAKANAKNPVGQLAMRMNRKGYPEGTYLDSLIQGTVATKRTEYITVEQRLENEEAKLIDAEEEKVDPRAVDLFGIGYDAREYKILLQHYDMLTKQFVNADNVQDSLIKDLCTTKLMQMQQRGDPDAYVKLTRSYQDTLKNSGLKTRSADEYADDESATWGQFIAQVEKFSPAEFYEQDELYKDVDGIGDYIQRFFTRPTLNYFGKTNEKDPEFSLTDEEINGE